MLDPCFVILSYDLCDHARIKGVQGARTPTPTGPPLKTHKAIAFLSNTGPDPLKNHKATKPNDTTTPMRSSKKSYLDSQ